MRLGLNNLVLNTKFLPLLALSVFVSRECGSFNAF